MNTETIGHAAGIIWDALREKGQGGITLAALKRLEGVRPEEAMAAVGWLAREGKISFATGKRGGVSVSLVETELVGVCHV